MKHAIGKFLEYLRSVKNSSPHTILNYGKDLDQFVAYLSPPGVQPPPLAGVTHTIIREFVGHLHDCGLQKRPDCFRRTNFLQESAAIARASFNKKNA